MCESDCSAWGNFGIWGKVVSKEFFACLRVHYVTFMKFYWIKSYEHYKSIRVVSIAFLKNLFLCSKIRCLRCKWVFSCTNFEDKLLPLELCWVSIERELDGLHRKKHLVNECACKHYPSKLFETKVKFAVA